MKKIHFSLFKKIFFIVFISLFVMQTVNLYLDYQKLCKQLAYGHINEDTNERMRELQEYCDTSLDLLSKDDIIKKANEIFKDYDSYYAIVENRDTIIAEKINYSEFSKKPQMVVSPIEDHDNFRSKVLSLENIPEEKIIELEKYIQDNFQEHCFTIQYLGKPDSQDSQTIQVDFLKVDDRIIFGESCENLNQYHMSIYSGLQLYYRIYHNSEDSLPYTMTSAKIAQLSQEAVLKSFKSESESIDHYTHHSYEKEDKNLVLSYNLPLPTRKLESKGLNIVAVEYYDSAFLMTFFEAYNDNVSVYMLSIGISLLVSLFISYMITKRIRRISSATHLISRNRFDMILDENPRDELGDLSADINRMNRNLKSTIDRLNEEIEHVKELESLRKDFVNQFTHEMKTPLGIINGYSELLDETEDSEEKEKYLEIINKETGRINDLIQSMLSLSRLEAGKVELNKENIDLEDLVTDIIEEYEVLLMKKNIHVDVKSVHNIIYADRKHIQTVLHNFLSNAIKHVNENGKIIVTIDKGVSIYNEGQPIDEDKIDGIWYTFVTHDKEGSGLGLAICRSILELHGFDYGVNNKSHSVEFYFNEKIN